MAVGIVTKTVRAAVETAVRAESAILERRPRSLDDVGAPIVVATHRRSGTHLTIDTLRRNFPECRPRMLPLENQHKAYLNIDMFDDDVVEPMTEPEAMRILGKSARPTIKTHAEPSFGIIEPRFRAFVDDLLDRSSTLCITRDGRKVMCSLWVWRKRFDPTSDVPFSEFIRQIDAHGRSRPREWADHVTAWLDRPGVVHYGFDDFVKQAPRTLGEIGERLGLRLELADPAIPPAVRTRSAAWLARLRGDLTSTNHHAAGIPTPKPDEVFSPDDNAFFAREAGGAMERLGHAIPG